MRYLILITTILIMSSCHKKTLKDNENYKVFIGKWHNTPGINEDEISIEFQTDGKMIVKQTMERTITYYPKTSYHRLSDYSTESGKFWDLYQFTKVSKITGSEGFSFFINPARDSIFSFTNIDNFFYGASNYLIK